MKEYFNLKQLISIKVFDFELSKNLFYAPERKNWRGRIILAHFEYRYSGLIMNLPLSKYDDVKIDGYRAYFKPKIILYFTDESTLSYTFNTYKEAIEEAEIIKNHPGTWIT